MSVHKGEKDPYLGYVAQGRKAYPAPLFQFAFVPKQSGWAMARTECVSVVVPFTGRSVPKFTAAAKVLGNSREVTVRWADGGVDRVVYRPGLAAPIFQAGDVRSDAALVLIRKLPGEDTPRVEQLLGSYAEVGE